MTADAPRRLAAQTVAEIRLTVKRGESVLVTVFIPVALLVFFVSSGLLPVAERGTSAVLAGTLSLAIISTGMVSLGIATAYERYYGVLKRLGLTPLSRNELITAKILSVLALEVAQTALLVGVAAALGWRPHGSAVLAVLALVLGTAAFSGIGMWMAGSWRAEATLAGANGLFLFFLLLGGVYVPLSHLPRALDDVAQLLPSAALSGVVRAALANHSVWTGNLLVLAIWALAAPVLAARTFRWE